MEVLGREEGVVGPLLIRSVEDITEKWLLRLLHHTVQASDTKGIAVTLRSWNLDTQPSKDVLAGFSSSRATVQVEYEVEDEVQGLKEDRREVYVVKMVPTQGYMAGLLTHEGMHHTEVGQYGRFLAALASWETEMCRNDVQRVVAELVPPHALALASAHHFTLVLPELTHLGYQANTVLEGLNEGQVLTVAAKMGAFHGTVVAYKRLTNTHLPSAFPACFQTARLDSPVFTTFTDTGFTSLRQKWTQDPSRAGLLQKLIAYEKIAAPFVVSNLEPQEPYATVIHGDLQPSNIFFRTTKDGETSVKLIDWATARYGQGPIDLVYLLNIGLETRVRRNVTNRAKDVYFAAFNAALKKLDAGISFPREVFEAQYLLGRQLGVVWSIMSVNLFFSSHKLSHRLPAILEDVLLDPEVPPPTLGPGYPASFHSI